MAAASCAAMLATSQAWARDEQGERALVVTGTRIRQADAAALEPLVTLDGARLGERGHFNVADALNELPGIRGSVTPDSAQASFGQGVNFINIYGLGSNRVLTLVNGRRMVSSNVPSILGNATPGNQVDLNAIPAILVERVDRVSVGGAPVYGSDAIAGTVNIVLRHAPDGLEMRAASGVTGRGDNFRWNLAAAGGTGFGGGRGRVTAAISVDRVRGLTGQSRSFLRASLANATNPCTAVLAGVCAATNLVSALGPAGRSPANDGRVNPRIGFNTSASDGVPGSVLIRDLTLPAVASDGVLSSGPGAYGWRFAPDGALVPHDRGVLFGAPVPGPLAAASTASGGDGLRLGDYVPITSGMQRLNAALLVDHDLTDRLRFHAEGLFYRGKADELVQLPAFNSTQFGGVSGPLTFRTDNPFLTAQARQQLTALGYAGTFQLSRAHDDLADLTGSSKSTLFRGVAAITGGFDLGGRAYDFDVSVDFGRSDFTDHGQTIDQQRFVNAVNAVAVDGGIVCSTSPVVTGFPAGRGPIADPACVPLNLFGQGAPSARALAYVLRDTVSKSRLEQLVVNANFGGTPFSLFGNPLRFNIGIEHRAEKAAFRPDPFLQAGLGRSVAIAPTRGRYTLDELSGEVLAPLIAPENGSLFARLELFGRIRHVMPSRGRGFTAWALGGTIAPIEDIAFRGNFTRSFRAPSVTELYSPRASVAVAVPDLCSPANIGAGPAPEIRRANCAAFLARYPGASPLVAATATVPGTSGGDPRLRVERADSFTWGVTLRPRFLPGLVASMDYVSIEIADPIASLTIAQIAQGCFDNADFDAADPANGNRFCRLIRRDAAGQVASDATDPAVRLGFTNGRRVKMAGVQASLAWRAGLGALGIAGALDVGIDLFNLRRRVNDITGVAPTDTHGIVGDPAWEGQLRLRYANAAWGASAQVNHTGRQAIARDNRGAAPNDIREFDHFRAFATVDGAVFLNAGKNFRLTISATNLFDRKGQRYFGEIVPLSINDMLGRRMALTLNSRW